MSPPRGAEALAVGTVGRLRRPLGVTAIGLVVLGLLWTSARARRPDDVLVEVNGEERVRASARGAGLAHGPARLELRRLMPRHYIAAVRDLLGDEAAAAASPPRHRAGRELGVFVRAPLVVDEEELAAYRRSARAVAAAAARAGALGAWLECEASEASPPACMRAAVRRLGRRAWRRALTADELERLTALGLDELGREGLKGLEVGLEAVAVRLLESPHFSCQVERIPARAVGGGRRRATAYELATRLSLLILDALPDAELLDEAEAGLLADAAGMRAAARRLAARPSARAAASSAVQWVDQRVRQAMRPRGGGPIVPPWNPMLAGPMRRETRAVVEDIMGGVAPRGAERGVDGGGEDPRGEDPGGTPGALASADAMARTPGGALPIVEALYRRAVGMGVGVGEREVLEHLERVFVSADRRVLALLVEIAARSEFSAIRE